MEIFKEDLLYLIQYVITVSSIQIRTIYSIQYKAVKQVIIRAGFKKGKVKKGVKFGIEIINKLVYIYINNGLSYLFLIINNNFNTLLFINYIRMVYQIILESS